MTWTLKCGWCSIITIDVDGAVSLLLSLIPNSYIGYYFVISMELKHSQVFFQIGALPGFRLNDADFNY